MIVDEIGEVQQSIKYIPSSEKELLQNSKHNILLSSISLDMKVYAMQLEQKSTAEIFGRILWNFRTATF